MEIDVEFDVRNYGFGYKLYNIFDYGILKNKYVIIKMLL